jgi:hypothetical protein
VSYLIVHDVPARKLDLPSSTFSLQNNLWYAADDPAASAPDLADITETDPVVGQDPGWYGEPDRFDISATSSAWVAGTPNADLPCDFYGIPYQSYPSIGASEYWAD